MVKAPRSSVEHGGLRVLERPRGAPALPTHEVSDTELIDAFERGEGHACETLYDRLSGVVEGTLFRVLGCRDEAHDDLVQAAFEQIVLRSPSVASLGRAACLRGR